jgi:hypothetical protein
MEDTSYFGDDQLETEIKNALEKLSIQDGQ